MPDADLTGLWRRAMIAWPDGRRDTTTQVHWLQGIDLFADLRQPASLVQGHAENLDELSMHDCKQLATQEGFAGRLQFDGQYYEWIRRINFQPIGASADAGALTWEDGILIERGRDIDYVEHWQRDPAALRAPCAALALADVQSPAQALLIRVGRDFMFARERTAPLPPGGASLTACIAGAIDLPAARLMIDCEISVGRIEKDGWRVLASTLPFRRGRLLRQRLQNDRLTTAGNGAASADGERLWEIVDSEGDLADIFTYC